ncbi:MAG: MFS transporter [Syntrophobacteraceae bacterium]|nr:MFS transporter [Syntrophobacteraceae bacterium]
MKKATASLLPGAETGEQEQWIETDIAARLDRLPWSRWHWFVVIGLGITWVLDGLEVTIQGAIATVLLDSRTLGLTRARIGLTVTGYLLGAVLGALVFGYLTDRLGRKKLFLTTLALYLTSTALTGLTWDFRSMFFIRFCTGAGIGGEYAAINSAIDELIPARVRGRTDLIINSTFWLGTALGSAASIFFLDPRIFPINLGWRLAFLFGAALGLIIIAMRRFIPESPRWLITHGHVEEAQKIVAEIEINVQAGLAAPTPFHPGAPPPNLLRIRTDRRIGFLEIIRTILKRNWRRSLLALCLMISQAFFYNGVYFSQSLVLVTFFAVAPDRVGLYLLPLAFANLFGPLCLGHFFDSVGRKPMIALTYCLSGVLLALMGRAFAKGAVTGVEQTLFLCLIFFIASSAASSAYLTASEIFPVETRALAIAIFYAAGTGVGGAAAPALFGSLIQTGKLSLMYGYFAGSLLMVTAALAEVLLGVRAERKSLEEIAAPMSSENE